MTGETSGAGETGGRCERDRRNGQRKMAGGARLFYISASS